MSSDTRRTFIVRLCAGAGALVATTAQSATTAPPPAAAPILSESDPQALALGYKADSTKVDKSKYPQHQPSQVCAQCNFFQGKPTDAMAPCQIFVGKQVAAKGWCTAYVKKA